MSPVPVDGDGLQAVRMLDTVNVDVILMDIRMPGIDGVEATRRIRLARSGSEIRVVVLKTGPPGMNVGRFRDPRVLCARVVGRG